MSTSTDPAFSRRLIFCGSPQAINSASLCHDSEHFVQQLRSCDFPPRPQITNLLTYIDKREDELRSIDAEILRIQETRQFVQKCQDQAKGLLSPIRRLPVEVLGEIFTSSAQVEGEVVRRRLPYYPNYPPTALRISQVCHRWRDIAQSTPRLWACATLSFDLDSGVNYVDGMPLKDNSNASLLLWHYFEMSKPLPLSLAIWRVQGRSEHDEQPVSLPETLRFLLLHSDRWGYAKLTFDEPMWNLVAEEIRARASPGMPYGYFPALHSLSALTSTPLAFLRGDSTAAVVIFKNAPRLTSVVTKIRNSFSLPFSQIESLAVVDHDDRLPHVSEVERTMNKCTRLEKLFLDIPSFHYESKTSMPLSHITLRLSTLEIPAKDCHLFAYAFRTLTLPALTKLVVGTDSENLGYKLDSDWPVDDFKSMISRSQCALKTFHLLSITLLTKDQLQTAFSVLPTLVDLRVTFRGPAGRVMDQRKTFSVLLDLLVVQRSPSQSPTDVHLSESTLLPNLSNLALRYDICEEWLAKKLLLVVNSRRPEGPSLSTASAGRLGTPEGGITGGPVPSGCLRKLELLGGRGKSELAKQLVTSLAQRIQPRECFFCVESEMFRPSQCMLF